MRKARGRAVPAKGDVPRGTRPVRRGWLGVEQAREQPLRPGARRLRQQMPRRHASRPGSTIVFIVATAMSTPAMFPVMRRRAVRSSEEKRRWPLGVMSSGENQ
jgi:hypothetical protein